MTQRIEDHDAELARLARENLLSAETLERALLGQEAEVAARAGRLALPDRNRKRGRWALLAGLLLLYVLGTIVVLSRYRSVETPRAVRAERVGDLIFRDGDRFVIHAVGWDPARPGEVPWRRDVSVTLVDDDFRRIRAAGFNTVRTWEAMSWEELASAERHGLAVLQGIWIEPDGDFADPDFQQRSFKKVRDIVGFSRESRAVIGYLVMNEPEAAHVREQGVEVVSDFLARLAAEVRALDPDALVSFSSWPGAELLTVPEMDFVAVNLHPFRPSVLHRALGYGGLVRVWRERLAGGRPLVISEFGLSVSPLPPTGPEAPGGVSEHDQALRLPEMADAIASSGASGGAVFSWIDGWWKGQDYEGDELRQDPDDPEEWFGLVAMERLDDPLGRDRPALDALARWHRAVVVSPRSGPVDGEAVPLEIHSAEGETLRAFVRIGGADAVPVVMTRQGRWSRGWIGLPIGSKGPLVLEVVVVDAYGEIVRRVTRTVYPPGEAPSLVLEVAQAGSLGRAIARVHDGSGSPIGGAEVRIALSSAEGTHDRVFVLQTDARGEVDVELDLPPLPGALLVAGLWLPDATEAIAVDAQVLGAP